MAHITRRLPLSDKVFYVQQAQKAANFYAAKLLQKIKKTRRGLALKTCIRFFTD